MHLVMSLFKAVLVNVADTEAANTTFTVPICSQETGRTAPTLLATGSGCGCQNECNLLGLAEHHPLPAGIVSLGHATWGLSPLRRCAALICCQAHHGRYCCSSQGLRHWLQQTQFPGLDQTLCAPYNDRQAVSRQGSVVRPLPPSQAS